MAANNNTIKYGKSIGDRREGRLIRSLPASQRLTPFLERERSDACNSYFDQMEVTDIEQWILAKRSEGWQNMGLLHLVIAAYIRTVSMRPGINRFVSGSRIYLRNDIQVVLQFRSGPAAAGVSSSVKLSFSAMDTVFDVYHAVNEAIDRVKASTDGSDADRLAASLVKLPAFLLRPLTGILRSMDRHDWLPQRFLEHSPYHASLGIVDLGSLGIQPSVHHIPSFGSIPLYLCFGAKRRFFEPDKDGNLRERRYVDYRITADGRIADAYYFAGALKCFKYFLSNPQQLELPPERVEDDLL